jgi:hypothetical protein
MGRAAGAAVLAFLFGGAAMGVLGGLLGGSAEAIAVALVGMGLVGSSSLLGSPKEAETEPSELVSKPRQPAAGRIARARMNLNP